MNSDTSQNSLIAALGVGMGRVDVKIIKTTDISVSLNGLRITCSPESQG